MYTITKYGKPEWIGKTFNDLTVIETVHVSPKWLWKCRCKCGSEKLYLPYKIIAGHTKSCGCAKKERCHEMTKKYRITHGGSGERLHYIWNSMKQRCTNPNNKDYPLWGGRGITVCDEWLHDYAAFRKWAYDNGYKKNLTIDRIDVNGNYTPDNCRWIEMERQSRNKRDNVYVEFRGERKLLIEFCEEFGFNYYTIYGRIYNHGWSVDEALSTPIGKCHRKITLKDKCEQHNLPYSAVRSRINVLGWSEEKALSTPLLWQRKKK